MSAVIQEPSQAAIVDIQLHHEIADFLYQEAELLRNVNELLGQRREHG